MYAETYDHCTDSLCILQENGNDIALEQENFIIDASQHPESSLPHCMIEDTNLEPSLVSMGNIYLSDILKTAISFSPVMIFTALYSTNPEAAFTHTVVYSAIKIAASGLVKYKSDLGDYINVSSESIGSAGLFIKSALNQVMTTIAAASFIGIAEHCSNYKIVHKSISLATSALFIDSLSNSLELVKHTYYQEENKYDLIKSLYNPCYIFTKKLIEEAIILNMTPENGGAREMHITGFSLGMISTIIYDASTYSIARSIGTELATSLESSAASFLNITTDFGRGAGKTGYNAELPAEFLLKASFSVCKLQMNSYVVSGIPAIAGQISKLVSTHITNLLQKNLEEKIDGIYQPKV